MTVNNISICKETRKIAANSLLRSIKKVWGRNFSEIHLRNIWLEELKKNKKIYSSGWYVPPPNGVAILLADENEPQRINPDSLRNKNNWPTSCKKFNHKTGLLIVYASPVHKKSCVIGDFGLVLYVGRNKKIINHFVNIYEINNRIAGLLRPGIKVKDIYKKSLKIFGKYGLRNNIISYSDKSLVNIGHSIPGITKSYTKDELKIIKSSSWKIASKIIAQKRIFLNGIEDYTLKEGDCFTVEPRLTNVSDKNLPAVFFHTIAVIKKDKTLILKDFVPIFKFFKMNFLLK